MTTVVDSTLVEIIRQRLVSIAEEAEAVIFRTAYSSTVAEAGDFSAAIFDSECRLVAQTPRALGAFIGVLGTALRVLLEHFPPETLAPGDTLATNDPWIGAGHLPDIITIQPVFLGDQIVAYTANVAHVSDIGGQPSAEASDMFEEGLLIPPCKLCEAGQINETVMTFITANSRLPRQVDGDIRAQITANKLAGRRIVELLGEYALPGLKEFSDDLQQRAEDAVRKRIAAVPDGEYRSEIYSDGADRPLKIAVCVSIMGERIHVDYTGTADQVRWGLNAPFNLTRAETMYGLRLAFAPDIPVVEGAVAPFSVEAPEGSVLNPRRPAPTMIRVTVVQNVFGALFQALAPLVPKYIAPNRIHAHFGGIWAIRFRGVCHHAPSTYRHGGPPQMNVSFTEAYFFNGGAGALPSSDGHTTISMPVNCGNIPVEIMEARTPVLYEFKRIVADSGGPGQFRGGLGQEFGVRILSDQPIDFVPGTNDRADHPPFGLFGGLSGRGGGMWIDGKVANRRRSQPVTKDQIVTVSVPGGGGCGNPEQRDPAAVRRDIEEGYVSPRAARQDYPVGPDETQAKEQSK